MSNPAWYDVEMRGRRLEAISKQMNEKFWNDFKENNIDMALTYLDRLLKIEAIIKPYVEDITGLNRFLRKHERTEDLISN